MTEGTPRLIGREWIAEFNLLTAHQATPQVSKLQVAHLTFSNLEILIRELKDFFDNTNLPSIHGFRAHLQLKPDAQYKLFKQRPVPYALKSKIKEELKRLEGLSIMLKVSAVVFITTSIVPVQKPNGQVCICEDFNVTVNRYLDLTQNPLPHIKEIVERLSGEAVY